MEHVAVGVILRGINVLVSKRDQNIHQGGLWEFPGGKRELNESIEETLFRELKEELGIKVTDSILIFSIFHEYPDKNIRINFFSIKDFFGEPCGLEGQYIKWQHIPSLDPNEFPSANHSIIEWLKNRN